MRTQYRVLALAGVAAAALLVTPMVASAQTVMTADKSYSEDVDVVATNTTNVSLDKNISVSKDIDITGTIVIKGELIANESAMSTVDNKQINNDNIVSIFEQGTVANNASLGGGALQTASGRIGVNVTAGDNNLQDNATVLSAIGSVATGASDAEVFSVQKGFFNSWDGTAAGGGGFAGVGGVDTPTNTTTILDNVLEGASGDIGLNVSTGAFNNQKNSLAVASVTGTAVLAEASAAILQESTFNVTSHGSTANTVTLGGSVAANASGNIGVNLTAGTNNIQANSLSISSVQ